MTGHAARFTGGGSLDGAELDLPGHVTGVVTTERDNCCSHYVLGDQADAYHFTGLNEIGATMAGFMREFTAAVRAEREAVKAAAAPVGCGQCGRTFANAAAHQIGHEGGRCLSDTAYGQLVLVDGVWDESWRHPELRR